MILYASGGSLDACRGFPPHVALMKPSSYPRIFRSLMFVKPNKLLPGHHVTHYACEAFGYSSEHLG